MERVEASQELENRGHGRRNDLLPIVLVIHLSVELLSTDFNLRNSICGY